MDENSGHTQKFHLPPTSCCLPAQQPVLALKCSLRAFCSTASTPSPPTSHWPKARPPRTACVSTQLSMQFPHIFLRGPAELTSPVPGVHTGSPLSIPGLIHNPLWRGGDTVSAFPVLSRGSPLIFTLLLACDYITAGSQGQKIV